MLTDSAFDLSTATHCSLLMRIGVDSFSYALVDTIQNKIMLVYDEQTYRPSIEQLSERIKTDPYLRLAFSQVKIACYTDKLAHFPESLFNKNSTFIQTALIGDFSSENLIQRREPKWALRSLMGFSENENNIFRTIWPDSRCYPVSSPMLQRIKTIEEDTALYMDFTAGAVYIVYWRSGELIFHQTFEISDADELNYYLLLLQELLALPMAQTTLCLSGIIHTDDDKYQRLARYFNDIRFILSEISVQSAFLNDMPLHYYTTLFTLYACE